MKTSLYERKKIIYLRSFVGRAKYFLTSIIASLFNKIYIIMVFCKYWSFKYVSKYLHYLIIQCIENVFPIRNSNVLQTYNGASNGSLLLETLIGMKVSVIPCLTYTWHLLDNSQGVSSMFYPTRSNWPRHQLHQPCMWNLPTNYRDTSHEGVMPMHELLSQYNCRHRLLYLTQCCVRIDTGIVYVFGLLLS